VPDGPVPDGGWPAVMMFHGLGGNHAALVAGLAPPYLAKGYAVFAPDARGHGTSGGFVSLDGPREVADVRTEFQWPLRASGGERHGDRLRGESRSGAGQRGTPSSPAFGSRLSRPSRRGATSTGRSTRKTSGKQARSTTSPKACPPTASILHCVLTYLR